MENLTRSTKKIKVSYCDPDATDSSSDEGPGMSQKKSKRKVHEIEVEFVEKNHNPRSNSGDVQKETGLEKPNLTSEGDIMVGVRLTQSGKFWAEIKDPIKKTWVWLGVFGTAEEASRAYLAEESKFAAAKWRAKQRVESAASQNSPFQDLVVESHNPPMSAGKKIEGVLRIKSGKFGASIRDPFKRKRVWLGSFTTAEEASRAYLAKKAQLEANMLRVQKLQFQAKMLRANWRIDRVASGKSTFQDSVSSVLGNDTLDLASFQGGARTRISEVRRRISGKFSAEIKDPITKRRVWLGTFDTEEEASRAYLAMEAELAAETLRANRRIDPVASDKSTFQDSVPSVLGNGTSNLTSFQRGARKRARDVRRKNSGKFYAEITNPITKRRVWIGSFATKVEANRAYLAKEAEFENELRAIQGIERVASEKALAPNSVSSVLEVETSDLSNETGVAESVGENKVSGDQEAGFGFFYGVQVVDKNGFLVGEFSMLDDLSICSEEQDANS